MATLKIRFFLVLLISMFGMRAFTATYDYDFAVENEDGVTIYYKYINDGTELQVTYMYYDADYSYSDSYFYKGNVVIPEEVTYMNRTRKVTSIRDRAFRNCRQLTSVTIPNSVKVIGEMAFADCSLQTITIGKGVSSIGRHAFCGEYDATKVTTVNISDISAWCAISFGDEWSNPIAYAHNFYLNGNVVNNLILPNDVTFINNYAFYGCTSLTSITIPNSVTSIGKGAFNGCSSLTSIAFPNSVTTIGDNSFRGCTSLTSTTFPNSLISIGNYAFCSCTSLTSITIPNSVTTIGENSFYGCSGLTSLTLGKGLQSIGANAFSGFDWYEVNITQIVSLIEKPFEIGGKFWEENRVFSLNTYNNATLFVPKGTLESYKATNGWSDFIFIEEGDGSGDTPSEPQKCARPTINYQNGKLIFNCDTEDAVCQSIITDTDIASYSSNEVQLGVTYNISVYATKAGFENSETATATLCWIDVEPKTEGIDNGIAQVRANAVMIKADGGIITVEGAEDYTGITVYSLDGVQVGSTTSRNGVAYINTNLLWDSIAIVKIGDRSFKVIMK